MSLKQTPGHDHENTIFQLGPRAFNTEHFYGLQWTLILTFDYFSGVLEVQLLDTVNLSVEGSSLADDYDDDDSSVFFANVLLTQQVRIILYFDCGDSQITLHSWSQLWRHVVMC